MARLVFWFVMLWAGAAQAWHEPARGSTERAALMDAIRPHAEWMLGAPVIFVVNTLRVEGGVAYASLAPQRPDGGTIDLASTPMVTRDGGTPDYRNGVAMQVLYVKSGQTWVALHWAIGATDVWYATPDVCVRFFRVIPEVCAG